ncbi:MAG: outer membrane lipoprotein-sorting protein [Myxococcota bacterium]|jgi:outer membrane lipoprotein-sorting protein
MRQPKLWMFSSLVLAGMVLVPTASAQDLDQAGTDKVIKEIDDRQRNSGDWKSQIVIKQSEKNKEDIVYKAATFRRDKNDKLIILFQEPKSEAGKGYLRSDKNLWFFDPRIGKWERRTERERIGGTGSNRQDFDESRLADEYNPRFVKSASIGKYETYQIELTVKDGQDVAYPKITLWVDKKSGNILKRNEYAASGKLMRRSLYPRWIKMFSKSKGTDVWYPARILIFDEIQKENRTDIRILKVDLDKLPVNIFTKGWLESKSR